MEQINITVSPGHDFEELDPIACAEI